MIEAETVTMDGGLQSLLEVINDMYVCTVDAVMRERAEDVDYYHKQYPNTKASHSMCLNFVFILCFVLGLGVEKPITAVSKVCTIILCP